MQIHANTRIKRNKAKHGEKLLKLLIWITESKTSNVKMSLIKYKPIGSLGNAHTNTNGSQTNHNLDCESMAYGISGAKMPIRYVSNGLYHSNAYESCKKNLNKDGQHVSLSSILNRKSKIKWKMFSPFFFKTTFWPGWVPGRTWVPE